CCGGRFCGQRKHFRSAIDLSSTFADDDTSRRGLNWSRIANPSSSIVRVCTIDSASTPCRSSGQVFFCSWSNSCALDARSGLLACILPLPRENLERPQLVLVGIKRVLFGDVDVRVGVPLPAAAEINRLVNPADLVVA